MYIKIHSKAKLDVIAHTLTRNGITVWQGIPEQIVNDLKLNGYKIKRRKSFKSDSNTSPILRNLNDHD